MILYRRQKRLWIGRLTIALVVVIGLSFAVVLPDTGWLSTWKNGLISSPFNGDILTTRTLTQTVTVTPGSLLAVDVPVGDITVVQGSGTAISVRTVVTAQGTSAAGAAHNARLVRWEQERPSAQEIDLSLVSTMSNALKGSKTTISIPSKMQVSLTDHLGNVTSSGSFDALTVIDNLGNITNRGRVAGELQLQSDLGDILQEGPVGSQTVIQDHLGDIQVIVPTSQSLQVDATTDMGSIHSQMPLSDGTATNTSLHGQIGSGSPSGTMQITNNLGDITVEGANVQ